MAKKKEPLSPVHCRQCSYAKDFIGNSCLCKAKGHRVCACDRYGRICENFKKKQ
jgi:hypothetical protein